MQRFFLMIRCFITELRVVAMNRNQQRVLCAGERINKEYSVLESGSTITTRYCAEHTGERLYCLLHHKAGPSRLEITEKRLRVYAHIYIYWNNY